jgi:hypothetical protein
MAPVYNGGALFATYYLLPPLPLFFPFTKTNGSSGDLRSQPRQLELLLAIYPPPPFLFVCLFVQAVAGERGVPVQRSRRSVACVSHSPSWSTGWYCQMPAACLVAARRASTKYRR